MKVFLKGIFVYKIGSSNLEILVFIHRNIFLCLFAEIG